MWLEENSYWTFQWPVSFFYTRFCSYQSDIKNQYDVDDGQAIIFSSRLYK